MKVTVENKKGLNKDLKVFIDKKTINTYMEDKYEQIKKTVVLKGFRPGKIPKDVLKRQFGKAIFGEVLDKVLKETSTKALDQNKIKPAGQPKIDLKTYGEDKDLEYVISVTELPKVEIKSVENIKFDEYNVKIGDFATDKRIKEIAKNQNNYKEVKPDVKSTEGNLVVFDYRATIDGKDFTGGEGKNTQLVLGKDLFIKGFDKQLLGVKKNQEKEVTVNLPENYPRKEFANKKANFKCKILKVKKPESVKIDDQFAKNLGAKDLSDLKQLVTKQIQHQYKMNLNALSKDNILKQIEKLHDVDLPDNLIQQELALISEGLKKEEIEKNKSESEQIAKKRIKLGLILNELGEKNNLKVEEHELKNEIQKQIQSMPNQQKQILEYYQKNPSATASLRGSIYEEKIINLIKEKSKKIKKIISIEEAEKIIHQHHKTHHHSEEEESKKSKKTLKSSKKSKKIRKK